MTNSAKISSGYTAPAVVRAFELLQTVADAGRPMSLSELSRELDCGKSSIHGLLKALISVKALNRSGKNYVMGPALAAIALKDWNILKLAENAMPILAELRNATEETVFLGTLGISRSTIIAVQEATKPLKLSAPPGTEIPLQAGAAGKALLSVLSNEEVDRFIQTRGLPEFTPNSITDPNRYLEELADVRRCGYALDHEEYLSGVKAVAAPVNNNRGLPMAVWVAGFASSMNNEMLEKTARKVLLSAQKLKQLIDQTS